MFWTGGLILCEDCWEYCSLKRRIEAVKRARKKRKMQDRGSETEDRGRGSDHSPLLPQILPSVRRQAESLGTSYVRKGGVRPSRDTADVIPR